MIHIDIETRSACDLPKRGAYNYAADPTTDVLCVCWAVDDGPIQSWEPRQPIPTELADAMADPDQLFWAHNAAFERLLFRDCIGPKYALPEVPLERWRCTAVLARSYALPSALGDVASAVGMPLQKDTKGKELIRRMSIPTWRDSKPYWEWSELLLRDMTDYCMQDVAVERAIHSLLPDRVDWQAYQVSERINDRGVLVDVPFAVRASGFADEEKASIKARFAALTGYPSPASPSFTRHVYEVLQGVGQGGIMHTLRTRDDGEVVDKLSLAGDIVDTLLEDTELPAELREPLELKQRYSRSSSAKFITMVDRACDDDRVRGAYVYLGARKTGRYSSQGLQMHNMPRDSLPDPFLYLLDEVPLELEVLPALIRPSIYTPDTFVCSDWAGIEARALPWLAGRRRGVQELLDLFRDGGDVYVREAKHIYPGQEITKARRQVGKVAVLALGYGGGVGAFQSMARAYGVDMTDEVAQPIVDAWRDNNRWAVTFWRDLMQAAMEAVRVPGSRRKAGRVTFYMLGSSLFCELPSGRSLCYPAARIDPPDEGREWAGPQLSAMKCSLRPAAGAEWPRERLWGGLLAENVTQAVCADILNSALVTMDGLGADIVGHTHDEIITECSEGRSDKTLAQQEAVMSAPPAWAHGLPLAVESWVGKWYRK